MLLAFDPAKYSQYSTMTRTQVEFFWIVVALFVAGVIYGTYRNDGG